MPNKKLTCGECGSELAADVRFCPNCGAKAGVSETKSAVPVVCDVCGHKNLRGGSFCEACGSKLSNASTSRPSSKQTRKKVPASSGRKLAPWHYALGVALLALAGYFIYVEVNRDATTHTHQQSPPPMRFPSQGAVTPPSKEILDAVARLEQTVKENPNDVGAQLLLANALHDGGMHDPGLLPRAIDAYSKYLKTQPGDPNARVDLGICYFELGKTDSSQAGKYFTMAINEMETAVKGSPTHQPGAFNLGIVNLYAGRLQESNKWLRRAVELNPESDLGKRAKAILDQHMQAG